MARKAKKRPSSNKRPPPPSKKIVITKYSVKLEQRSIFFVLPMINKIIESACGRKW